MIKLFAFPFVVAGLMALAWVSTLGGSREIVISGLLIFCFNFWIVVLACLLYTSPSPRDRQKSRMPSSA